LYSFLVSNIHTTNDHPLILLFNDLVSPEIKWVSLYWVFAVTAMLMVVVISVIKFPKVNLKEEEKIDIGSGFKELLANKYTLLYFLGIFCYVGTEQGIANWTSKFLQMYHGVDPATTGAKIISYFWGLLTIGCLLGLVVLKLFDSRKVLMAAAAGTMITLLLALFGPLTMALVCFPLTGLFLSVMWSILVSLGLNSVARHHGTFSGILCTGIAGGAVVPLVIGGLGEWLGSLQLAMITLFLTLAYIFSVGIWAKPLINNATIKNWRDVFRLNAS
jgi:fucose permease